MPILIADNGTTPVESFPVTVDQWLEIKAKYGKTHEWRKEHYERWPNDRKRQHAINRTM